MLCRIHAMFFHDRYLLNEVHVKIQLVRSRNSFCLMTAGEFKVKIESVIMFVRKVKLSPSVSGSCQGVGEFHCEISSASCGV